MTSSLQVVAPAVGSAAPRLGEDLRCVIMDSRNDNSLEVQRKKSRPLSIIQENIDEDGATGEATLGKPRPGAETLAGDADPAQGRQLQTSFKPCSTNTASQASVKDSVSLELNIIADGGYCSNVYARDRTDCENLQAGLQPGAVPAPCSWSLRRRSYDSSETRSARKATDAGDDVARRCPLVSPQTLRKTRKKAIAHDPYFYFTSSPLLGPSTAVSLEEGTGERRPGTTLGRAGSDADGPKVVNGVDLTERAAVHSFRVLGAGAHCEVLSDIERKSAHLLDPVVNCVESTVRVNSARPSCAPNGALPSRATLNDVRLLDTVVNGQRLADAVVNDTRRPSDSEDREGIARRNRYERADSWTPSPGGIDEALQTSAGPVPVSAAAWAEQEEGEVVLRKVQSAVPPRQATASGDGSLDSSGSDGDLRRLKDTARKLNLKTRRQSYLTWRAKYLDSRPVSFQPEVKASAKGAEGKLTKERMERVDDALQWIKKQLVDLRRQDQSLARQLLGIRHELSNLKLALSCEEHQDLLDDAQDQIEELRELSRFADFPPEVLGSSAHLKHIGVTKMNLSSRRFSTC